MANQLKMDTVQAIQALHRHGWSNQRIAEELGIHRTTVAGYLKPKPTQVTVGSEGAAGSVDDRSRSLCEPYRDVIQAKLETGDKEEDCKTLRIEYAVQDGRPHVTIGFPEEFPLV